MCAIQYKNSMAVTKTLVKHVVNQKETLDLDEKNIKIEKNKIKMEKVKRNTENLENVRGLLNPLQLKVLEAVSEAGASSWMNAVPLKQYGFHLDKQAFRDALYLRYGISLQRLPQKCVCGAAFDEIHALNCPRGGFDIIRHNEVRDLTAELLTEVCSDVSIEPALTSLNGERFTSRSTTVEEDARCDVAARGFWIHGNKGFLDVRVFNPLARSYAKQTLSATYNSLEKSKKGKYNERILNVEHYSL